jgi:hypothetical protein
MVSGFGELSTLLDSETAFFFSVLTVPSSRVVEAITLVMLFELPLFGVFVANFLIAILFSKGSDLILT